MMALEERFWSKVNKDGPIVRPELGPCWVWTGGRQGNGYGELRVNGKVTGAHRIAWFLETGDWLENCVLHRCDNKSCVRFSHLFAGTQQNNVADMVTKNRQARGDMQGLSKLSDEKVIAIRQSYREEDVSQYTLALRYRVSQSTIRDVVAGSTWSHVQ